MNALYSVLIADPIHADLQELHAMHCQRLSEANSPALPFDSENALGEYEDIERQQAQRLVSLGYAKLLWDGNCWRYTFKGALLNYYYSFLKQLKDATAQRERIDKKRPGS